MEEEPILPITDTPDDVAKSIAPLASTAVQRFLVVIATSLTIWQFSWLSSSPVAHRDAEPHPIELRIDLNSAPERELSLLPGLGPSLAKRIIVERNQGGAFQSVNDLQRVAGIGPKKVEAILPIAFVDESDTSLNLK